MDAPLNVIDFVVEIVMQLVQITVLELVRVVRAIAVAIVSVIVMRHVKGDVKNHVVAVVRIHVQEALKIVHKKQNNNGKQRCSISKRIFQVFNKKSFANSGTIICK